MRRTRRSTPTRRTRITVAVPKQGMSKVIKKQFWLQTSIIRKSKFRLRKSSRKQTHFKKRMDCGQGHGWPAFATRRMMRFHAKVSWALLSDMMTKRRSRLLLRRCFRISLMPAVKKLQVIVQLLKVPWVISRRMISHAMLCLCPWIDRNLLRLEILIRI